MLRVLELVFGFLAGGTKFVNSPTRPARPGPTRPPIHWMAGALSPGVRRLELEADTSDKLMPRLRIHGATPPLPSPCFLMKDTELHLRTLYF